MASNLERIPPQAIEAEQAVLGAMLISKAAVDEAIPGCIEAVGKWA